MRLPDLLRRRRHWIDSVEELEEYEEEEGEADGIAMPGGLLVTRGACLAGVACVRDVPVCVACGGIDPSS